MCHFKGIKEIKEHVFLYVLAPAHCRLQSDVFWFFRNHGLHFCLVLGLVIVKVGPAINYPTKDGSVL